MNMVNGCVNDYIDDYEQDFFPYFSEKEICKNTEIRRRQFMIIQYYILVWYMEKFGVYKQNGRS
jgi:hypothetical protein